MTRGELQWFQQQRVSHGQGGSLGLLLLPSSGGLLKCGMLHTPVDYSPLISMLCAFPWPCCS
jgi:hypothetical protein